MKICYLANSSLPSRYANSVHVANMADGLTRAGAEVTLFAFRGDRSLLPTSGDGTVFDFYGLKPTFQIEWLPNPMARGRSVLASLATLLWVKRFSPDLVIGRHGKACAAAAFRGIPTVYETHKPLSWNSLGDKIWLDRLFKTSSFRGLVTISQPLRDMLVEESKISKSRILVAPDAATPQFVAAPIELGSPERMQVGYVGTFHPGRGIEMILDLAAALEDMDFHLIGGTRHDLSKWYGGAVHPKNVTFHGFQTPSRAAAMRAGCDVLLAPYQRETFIKDGWNTANWMSPLKVFEYMSSAKPILCSDLPVLREVMKHEHNAILLPPESLSNWIAALRRLQNDGSYAGALAQSAFEDFLCNYTWEQRAQRILDFASGDQERADSSRSKG